MNTDQLIANAAPKLASLGAAFYFDPATVAVGKERGLDGFRFYFLGRGGVMGDVEANVVVSTFGYFAPAVVEKMWTTGSAKLPPREAATLYMECCRQFGRDHLSGVPDLDIFCMVAESINAAADPAGLPLFAGISVAPLPDDAPGHAMQLIATLREYRGSAHLVAVLANGLTAQVAHYLKRPEDYASFGWGETPPPVDPGDRERQAQAEKLTDQLVRQAFSVVNEADADTVVQVLTDIEAALKK